MATARLGAGVRDIRRLFEEGSTVGVDDGLLLARFANGGDPAAFEALVERHGPMVLATARAILARESDVEDVFQATFLVLARKAGSIRGGDALGGWLHRVAYRAAVQASKADRKRRRLEAEASAMATLNRSTTSSGPDPDVRAILHEEIERLPESGRLPVVLCDLEGCTYEEAARRLRWTVSIVRGRLAAARQKLRIRLTRRGVAPVALGIIFAPGAAEARSVVPEAMLRSTVSAVTGGSASAGALMLSRTLLKGMLMAKILSVATTILAALAVGSAGVMAVGRMGTGPEPAAAPPPIVAQAPIPKPVAAPVPAAIPGAIPESEMTGDVIELKGQVVGPDGKPVTGARVALRYLKETTSVGPEVAAGAEGRFSIRASRADLEAPERPIVATASAPGFGSGFANLSAYYGYEVVTIKLIEEGAPIEGRVLDLEDRPIGGARVRVDSLYYAQDEKFAPWVPGVVSDDLRLPLRGMTQMPARLDATTGPDGRFRLMGVGRDRVAMMTISGPSIATELALAMTRPGPEIWGTSGSGSNATIILHPPQFDHSASPTKPIRGIARDQDSGRPIEGLRVEAFNANLSAGMMRNVYAVATTDADGRYEISGLPKADTYQLTIGRNDGGRAVPYLASSATIRADTPGVRPVTHDISLKRAVVVRGRVTDKGTGRPVPGYINVYTLPDTPIANSVLIRTPFPNIYLDADGRYEVAVAPGKTFIACLSDRGRYLPAKVDPASPGYDPSPRAYNPALGGLFPTSPRQLFPLNYHALAFVDLDPKAGSKTVDLQVEGGRIVDLNVLDPEGKPIEGGCWADGVLDFASKNPAPGFLPPYQLRCVVPGSPRRVKIMQDARKLVGSIYLKGDEVGPITVTLQPWAEVTGRALDAEGKPIGGRDLNSLPARASDRPEEVGIVPQWSWMDGPFPDTAAGKFRATRLVPGLKYSGGTGAVTPGFVGGLTPGFVGVLFRDIVLKPGEVRDLGDLKVQVEQVPPIADAGVPKADEIKGRVVGPDGRPVAGARIVPSFYESSIKPLPEATSGSDGRFAIRMPKSDRVAGRLDTSQYPWLVASAKGFGPGHAEGVQREGIGEVTIKLVEDTMPVEGRIVDLEGRAVVGAKIKVERAYFAKDGDLAPWLAQLPNRGLEGMWSGLSSMPVAIEVKTGLDGRFKLEGVGRDRVAAMVVSGPSIANDEVHAMTRAGAEMTIESGLMDHKRTVVIHPSRFDHAAAPSKPIRGVVRDKDTGRPIAGMQIEGGVYDGFYLIPARDVDAVTDAEGRYTLNGLPKAEAYRIFMGRGRERFLPYPNATLKVPAGTPGLEPVTFDIALKRGVVVRGRVTDKVTSKPVAGWVSVFTFADNPAAAEFPGYAQSYIQQAFLDADGRYEVGAPPGRSLVVCRSDMARYRAATGAESIPGYDSATRSFKFASIGLSVNNYHALVAANLDPKAESTTIDIQLDPGRVVQMTALDPDGKPIGGTRVEGTSDLMQGIPIAQELSTFEIRSLSPGQPRRVTITHEGRKLVGSVYLKGDEAGPITIKLQPWGEVSGRIVDDAGKPLKGYGLFHATGDPPGPLDQIGVLPGGRMGGLGAKAEPDGRFRVVGLVPGLKYGASALEGGESTVGLLFHDVVLKSGEVRDLGDLKIEPRQPVARKEEAAPGSVAIQGRVVGPDGAPVAGASVVPALGNFAQEPPETATDADGRFAIRVPGPRGSMSMARTTRFPWLVASAPGFGPGFVEGMYKEGLGEVTIKLAEEGPPIEGRVVDLEGRPVAGAKVKVRNVSYPAGGDFAAWTRRLARVAGQAPPDGPEPISLRIEATAGLDGRFKLLGVGRDRAVTLMVSGPGVATDILHMTNRPGPAVVVEAASLIQKGTFTFHPSGSDLALAPSKSVRGVVRDKDTGRPIEGLRVIANGNSQRVIISSIAVDATTDAKGRYSLDGLPKAEAYQVSIRKRDRFLPYPQVDFRVPGDTPGLEPVTFDASLKRGVVVRGRVTDRVTGLPVEGQVFAHALRDNPALADFPGFVGTLIAATLDPDGRYELVTVPGRNLIGCRSDVTKYRTFVGIESIKGYDPALRGIRTISRTVFADAYHALVDVELDPKADSATVDLQVDPGRSVEVTVVDPEGRPVGGTRVVGMTPIPGNLPEVAQESPTFAIRSLTPGQPRRVTVTHDARKLVGSIYLKGDEPGPITLKLEPWSELTGRVMDEEGSPVKGHFLHNISSRNLAHPEDVGALPIMSPAERVPVGADGRFRFVGLVSGLKYSASVTSGNQRNLGVLFRDVALKPGEVRDLGELKVAPRKE